VLPVELKPLAVFTRYYADSNHLWNFNVRNPTDSNMKYISPDTEAIF